MPFQPWSYGITFADIKHFTVTFGTWAQEKVDAGLLELITTAHFSVEGARKDDSFAYPVGTID
jgi:hypothetical protein